MAGWRVGLAMLDGRQAAVKEGRREGGDQADDDNNNSKVSGPGTRDEFSSRCGRRISKLDNARGRKRRHGRVNASETAAGKRRGEAIGRDKHTLTHARTCTHLLALALLLRPRIDGGWYVGAQC